MNRPLPLANHDVQMDAQHGSVTFLPEPFSKVESAALRRTRVKAEATLLVSDRIEFRARTGA